LASIYKKWAALGASFFHMEAATHELFIRYGRRRLGRHLELTIAAGGGRIEQSNGRCPNQKL
jgi:hypothetical protein